ncbi:murein transglycosylase A [Rhizobium halophilum]|uniref:murein transglycosylase A n=1 Tax=Rhizobium halophilum TaxID=2846852 RepID=UPI001EFD3205|nr:murein transglycosylase A [Rhizobium halophilum]MCF6369036.1 murein transglycosylase A [Rhizobium halophilum]
MTGDRSGFSLSQVDFQHLPGWASDDPSDLVAGMRTCLRHVRTAKPYRSGALGLATDDILAVYESVESRNFVDAQEARQFFEAHFLPFQICKNDGSRGFVTGFYEPEVDVDARKSEAFPYPFYRRPKDLVDLDEANRPSTMEPSYAFGRLRDGEIGPYPDRREIDHGYLEGRGLEIAWARSKVDVFFAHVQGAARLRYPDGSLKRITYAAKAGHPFSAVGKLLIDRGEIDPATVSMQSIRTWLAENPAKVDEVLWHNRSYIFFREAEVAEMELGPIAAAKVPLLAGRSLAVDRLIHTFGFPFFVHAPTLTHLDDGRPFARTLLALDTGSAIVGPARGDIFTGSGARAGDQAGTIRHDADFYILIPKAVSARFGR